MSYHANQPLDPPLRIRLFRGEAPEREAALRGEGVRGREPYLGVDWPGMRAVLYEGLPNDLVADLYAPHFHEHVVDSSAKSPLVSWSLDPRKAIHYALAGGERQHGLIVTIDVCLVTQHLDQPLEQWHGGHFDDDCGRGWFLVAQFASDARTELLNPGLVAEFRRRGIRDAEFLQLGVVSPDDISIRHWPPSK